MAQVRRHETNARRRFSLAVHMPGRLNSSDGDRHHTCNCAEEPAAERTKKGPPPSVLRA
jgi:hypothetical protein